jgi:UPF0271 protein
MKKTLKLNCDLGEKVHDNDALIMPYIDQANIACGFHASDPVTMQQTVKLAIQHDVEIGAHPSYPDKANFGRTSMQLPRQALISMLHYQIGALDAICQAEGAQLLYVKPHGALYNDMMADVSIFESVCLAISTLNRSSNKPLSLMIQALPDNSIQQQCAKEHNIHLLFEVFADRAYQNDGLLVARSNSNAVIHDVEKVNQRLISLCEYHTLNSSSGVQLRLTADSLCVHGDNPEAIKLVQKLHKTLNAMI